MDDSKKYDTGFHGTPLLYSWMIGANLAVLIAAIRWSKYSFYLHLFIAFTIILFTLLSTIHILDKDWIYPNHQNQWQMIHNIVGLVLVCWIGLQTLTGILARLSKRSNKLSPNLCMFIRKVHLVLSYLMMLMSKYNYLGIKFIKGSFKPKFLLYLAIDIAFLTIYILLKYKYLTLSQVIINKQIIKYKLKEQKNFIRKIYRKLKDIFSELLPFSQNGLQNQLLLQDFKSSDIRKIQDQKQINLENYVIFNDYIYDTSNLVNKHPGGQYIRIITNKRQVDRFLYGFHSLQLQINLKPFSHTKDCLNICGLPVAKIQRLSPIQGMNDLSKARIISIKKIANQSTTYLLNIKIISQQKIQFVGYQNLCQFGQYFTISIFNQNQKVKCTRLYTSIWSFRNTNIQLIKNYFMQDQQLSLKDIKDQLQINQNKINQSIIETQNKFYQDNQIIPLLIKKYDNGKLTSQLLNGKYNQDIFISKPMGKGLNYHKIQQSGKVIFICGGTGILPFCDFIDILFKRIKYLSDENLTNMLQKLDPIVKIDIIKERTFHLYLAVQFFSDIPQILLFQIHQLCNSDKSNFNVTLRINRDQNIFPQKYKSNIKLTRQFFNQPLKNHLKSIQTQKISKIYICGPKLLNYNIGKLLINEKISQQFYQFM